MVVMVVKLQKHFFKYRQVRSLATLGRFACNDRTLTLKRPDVAAVQTVCVQRTTYRPFAIRSIGFDCAITRNVG